MTLADLVQTYITFKQALGRRFDADAKVLRAFCRALGPIEAVTVSPGAVRTFLAGTGPVTPFWHLKYRILGSFYRYAIGRGFVPTSPLPTTVPICPPGLTPYIYSTAELQRLVAATIVLRTPKSPVRDLVFRTLLLLLYGTGIRVGEALALTLADVDLTDAVLIVRETKFFKTRLVPIGPRLTAELAAYASRRRDFPLPAGVASAFLATHTGQPLRYDSVNRDFGVLRRCAGIRRDRAARYQPRLHDLRQHADSPNMPTLCRRPRLGGARAVSRVGIIRGLPGRPTVCHPGGIALG
jgi:integrase/recombinase XerD